MDFEETGGRIERYGQVIEETTMPKQPEAEVIDGFAKPQIGRNFQSWALQIAIPNCEQSVGLKRFLHGPGRPGKARPFRMIGYHTEISSDKGWEIALIRAGI